MITSPEDYLNTIQHIAPLAGADQTEELAPEAALGRELPAALAARLPSPPFTNSQMDGYAISKRAVADGAHQFTVGPTIAAGTDPREVLTEGEIPAAGEASDAATELPVAIPIMTGARVPDNTGAIIPVEKCQPAEFLPEGEQLTIAEYTAGSFIRERGSDIAEGAELFPAGTLITPAVIATLASQGIDQVSVRRRPRVLLCVGGAEIGGHGPATIPDANGPLLRALCQRAGIEVAATVHTSDDVEALASELTAAIAEHHPDVVITSGGISHGKFEVFRTLLTEHADASADHTWFGHVAQQPGGPQGYGRLGDTPVICLPGNPISTLVSFRLFIAPHLAPASIDASADNPLGALTAYLMEEVAGLPDHRDQFRRGIHQPQADGTIAAAIIGGASSHLLSQGAAATCLIRIPAGSHLKAGQPVTIYPL